MQTENRLFDDFARMASGALSTLSGLREEIETRVRERFERMLTEFDLVTREEFEAVREMAAKARDEQEELAARLAALEQRQAGGQQQAAATAGTARKRAAPGKRAAAGATGTGGGTAPRGRGRRAAATPADAKPGSAGTPPVTPEV